MKKIAVVGATGMLGTPVAKKLKEDGFEVKICSRNTEKAKKMFPDGYEIVKADVLDWVTMKEALAGCDGVHINLHGGPEKGGHMKIEYGGTVNIVNAAISNKLQLVTFISGVSSSKIEYMSFPPTHAKIMAEDVIVNSGMPYTIFRPSWFMESLKLFVRGNSLSLIGNPPNPFGWVAVEDYARMVSAAYKSEDAKNKKFFIIGPEKYTMKQAAEIYANIIDPKMKVKTMPIWQVKLIGAISFNAKLKALGSLMAFFEKFAEDVDPAEANKILGEPKITLKEWAEKQK